VEDVLPTDDGSWEKVNYPSDSKWPPLALLMSGARIEKAGLTTRKHDELFRFGDGRPSTTAHRDVLNLEDCRLDLPARRECT
jgi:hypothetical protein